MDISLYFHIPFCLKKCPYCQFYSVSTIEKQKEFVIALRRELALRLPLIKDHRVVSVYFGGGTPSLLDVDLFYDILGDIDIDDSVELTLEVNPDDIFIDKVKAYKDLGFNRISMGVQSFDDTLLTKIGRRHNSAKAISAVGDILGAGIDNVSIDLMYDLPNQELEVWENTLLQACRLPVTHLSLYNLTIEPGTSFYYQKEEIRLTMADDTLSEAMFDVAGKYLGENGFERYEISAFSRKGKLSKHNIGYWTGRNFIGLGPSAFSFWNGRRFQNTTNLTEYCNSLEKSDLPEEFEERLPQDALRREQLVVQLRMLAGVDLMKFQDEYGVLSLDSKDKIAALEEDGLLKIEHNNIKLSDRGLKFYDYIAVELI